MNRNVLVLPLVVTGMLLPAHLVAAAEAIQTARKITAEQLLPDSTVIYAEVAQPKKLLATLLDHPIRKDLEQKEPWRQALRRPGFRTFRAVVALLESEIGEDWRKVIETITQNGIAFAVDAETEGAAILVRSSDAELLKKTRDAFLHLARTDAKHKGKPDPFRMTDYRGIEAYRAGEARFATVDQWFVMTNKDELGKKIVDNLLQLRDGGAVSKSLAADQQFQKARAAASSTAWGYLNVGMLREAGVAKKLFAGKTDNPVGELLVGGLLDTISHTPYVTAGLDVSDERVALQFAMPHDPKWTTEARQYFFGPEGKGTAPALLQPNESLLSIATYRDLPAMWAASDQLYEENVSAKIAQADSNLSNLFSGRDFGREILGAIHPQMSLVVARQQFDTSQQPVPDIKLPAAAALFKLNDPKIARQLKVSFQSLIGLVNFGQGQKGLPQFELNSEQHGKAQLVSATYLVDEPSNDGDQDTLETRPGIIQFNLSPTLAILGDQLIISTSRTLAKDLATSLATGAKAATGDKAAAANTKAVTDIQAVSAVLTDNRDHFIAQNMLKKGHDRAEAKSEINAFLDLLSYLRQASLQLVAEPDQLELVFEVTLNER